MLKNQTVSKSMNRKFKIDDCWARNMFGMINIDFCMANKTLEGVNEYV